MGLIEDIRQKIAQYEGFRKDFAGEEEIEKRLMMSLFVAELTILENTYFKELNSRK